MKRKFIFHVRCISIYTVILSFMIIGCKSISSSASSTDTSFPTWVVFDSTEFQQAQARGKYPDPIAIYREEGQGSYFYAMAFNPAGKTLDQAKTYCDSLANKGWGHSIRLPSEDDINLHRRGDWISEELLISKAKARFYEEGESYLECSRIPHYKKKPGYKLDLAAIYGPLGVLSFWINKQREDKDIYGSYGFYSAYAYRTVDHDIINLPSNNGCPFVVCVSSEDLENINKISEPEWKSYLERIEQQKSQSIEKYCNEHPKESCCHNEKKNSSNINEEDEFIRQSSTVIEIREFKFDENDEVIGCSSNDD